ncbi:MAG: hypothetical protein QXM65_05630 [Candidatus Bathyarchaeia archaeon]
MIKRQELLQQHNIEEKKKENGGSLGAYPNAHNGKIIVQMQVCICCGKTFPFKKGRKTVLTVKQRLK